MPDFLMDKQIIKIQLITEVGGHKHESEFATPEPVEPTVMQIAAVQKYAMDCHMIDCETVSLWAKELWSAEEHTTA